jgi:hypothetical protein
MTIRKKDGNLYILDGPNPIVKEQISWEPEKLVFHNFSWDEITYSSARSPTKKEPARKTKPTQKAESTTTIAPEAQTEEIAPEAPKEKESAPPPVESQGREFDLPYIKYKVLCYCLPAETKVHVDKLYGESWQKVTYGKKFVFPCVVTEAGDFSIEFWTSDPNEKIKDKSIIYPFSYEVHNTATGSYDKVPYDEYRWWKVSEREKREGGWFFVCVPSESQPDFSD